MKKSTLALIVVIALGVLYYIVAFFFVSVDTVEKDIQEPTVSLPAVSERAVPLPGEFQVPAGIDPRKESRGPTYPPPGN